MSALTKMMIVLQLVFSLVVSVLLVLFISRTENYKDKDAALTGQNYALGAQVATGQKDLIAEQSKSAEFQRQLAAMKSGSDSQVADLTSKLTKSEQDLTAAKISLADRDSQIASNTTTIATQAASLDAQNKELALLRDQVPTLVRQNSELVRAKQEVDNQLAAANLAIKQYQVMLAQKEKGAGAGSPTAGGLGMAPQVVAIDSRVATNKVNGTVTDVAMSAGRMRIEMPLGTRDGIQVGTRMYVYRANGYVGDVTVETVTPEQSVAVVVSTKAGETVQKGDLVSTTGN